MTFVEHKRAIEEYMYFALWHFLDHACGAAFFKHPEKLFRLTENQNPENILEIGTGVGYSAYILHCAAPLASTTTIEQEKDHCQITQEKLKDIEEITVVHAKAEEVLTTYPDKSLDLIFYDGYAPRLFFLKEFERLLTKHGMLISANSHKSGYSERDGSTKAEYLEALKDSQIWKFEESFADVLVYRKISE
jgi:predicted O-methyltransferase YrrM